MVAKMKLVICPRCRNDIEVRESEKMEFYSWDGKDEWTLQGEKVVSALMYCWECDDVWFPA